MFLGFDKIWHGLQIFSMRVDTRTSAKSGRVASQAATKQSWRI